jgi:hypothetical protein
MVFDDYDIKSNSKYDFYIDVYGNTRNIPLLVNEYIMLNDIPDLHYALATEIIKFIEKLKGGLAILDSRQIVALNGHVCFRNSLYDVKWILVRVHRHNDPTTDDDNILSNINI